MPILLALLPQIIAALPAVEGVISSAIIWIGQLRSVAQQSGEWTDTHEIAFLNLCISARVDPKYLPDAEFFAQFPLQPLNQLPGTQVPGGVTPPVWNAPKT